MKPKRYPYSGIKKESNANLNITFDSKKIVSSYYSPLLSVERITRC